MDGTGLPQAVQILRTSYSTEDTPVHALGTVCAATRHLFPIGQAAGADES